MIVDSSAVSFRRDTDASVTSEADTVSTSERVLECAVESEPRLDDSPCVVVCSPPIAIADAVIDDCSPVSAAMARVRSPTIFEFAWKSKIEIRNEIETTLSNNIPQRYSRVLPRPLCSRPQSSA